MASKKTTAKRTVKKVEETPAPETGFNHYAKRLKEKKAKVKAK